MATIADYINSGLVAASNVTKNQYLPEQLRLANEYQGLVNNFYAPEHQALLNNQIITNQYLPDKLRLDNQRAQQINRYYPDVVEQEIKEKQLLNENPLLNQSGIAGQLGAAIYAQNNGLSLPNQPNGLASSLPGVNNFPQNEKISPVQMILNGINTSLNNKDAFGDYYKKRSKSYDYMSLPIDNKSAILAQAAGMGYDYQEATKLLMDGATIEQLAKAKGFNMGNLPDPIYPATKTSVTQIQRRQQALEEINQLNPVLNEAVAPYQPRIKGYSPKQVADALKGTNKDQQAKFLAARALSPEMSALRLRAMSGQVGIEALREVTNKSMANINAFESLVDKDVYKKANMYVDQWLTNAVNAANKTGLSSIKKVKSNNRNAPNQEDLDYTAKKYGMTVKEVKQRLGLL